MSTLCRDARDKRVKLAHYRAISGDSWCTADPAVIRPRQLQPLSTCVSGCCPACALLKASVPVRRVFVCLFVCLFVIYLFFVVVFIFYFPSTSALVSISMRALQVASELMFSCHLFRFAFVYVKFDSRPHFLKLRHTHIRTHAHARTHTCTHA